MVFFEGKIALITGASSGIGKATALALAQQGATVGLMARRQDELETVASQMDGKGIVLVADVTDEIAVQEKVAWLVEKTGGLDIVVGAAGISLKAPFGETTTATIRRVMEVNYMGTVHVTKAVLPHLKERKGSLVAVSSLSGRQATPEYSVYGSSKFAIQGLYDALRIEMIREGVHVGVFSPGFVDTPLRYSVLKGNGVIHETPPVPPLRLWPVESCVKKILEMIRKRKKVAMLPGFVRYILALNDLILPGWVGDFYLRYKFGYLERNR